VRSHFADWHLRGEKKGARGGFGKKEKEISEGNGGGDKKQGETKKKKEKDLKPRSLFNIPLYGEGKENQCIQVRGLPGTGSPQAQVGDVSEQIPADIREVETTMEGLSFKRGNRELGCLIEIFQTDASGKNFEGKHKRSPNS